MVKLSDDELVKTAMKERGWSQYDIADTLGLSQGQVSLITTGKAHLRSSERMELNRIIARSFAIDDFRAKRFACKTLPVNGDEVDIDAVLDHIEMCPRCLARVIRDTLKIGKG